MQGDGLHPGARRLGPALVVGFAVLLVLRAVPLIEAYGLKVLSLHSPVVVAAAALGAAGAFVVLWILFARRPRAATVSILIAGAAMTLASGNAPSAAAAAGIVFVAAILGDAVLSMLLGRPPDDGDFATVFAAGVASAGLLVLLLAEASALRPVFLAASAAVLLAARWRRVPAVLRMLRAASRVPRGGEAKGVEAAWLAYAALVLLAVWCAVQSPDVSWDGLAYHLPEARDLARTGAVRPLSDLAPHSLLWRNYDAFLSLGFFGGGEAVVRFLQFAVGLAVFAAACALARRVGAGKSSTLVVLALTAFPTAMLQLHATYVDWPTALFTTACAAELARARSEPGRIRAAGFLLGAAVAASALSLAVLLPWAAWSERRVGSWTEPFAPSVRAAASRVSAGHYFRTSPASGEARQAPDPKRAVTEVLRLPYDLVFHSSRFEANGDGYNGLVVLLLAVGILGWRAGPAGLFAAAAIPVLAVWSLLYLPSIRYLFPMYPLYAVFAAEGLRRLTRGFAGDAGIAAGAAILTAAAVLPVQFGSSGVEWSVALGRMPREESLAARLPSYPLWASVSESDRVVMLGENDRFHCPAGVAWRAEFLPVSRWGADPAAWRAGLKELSITRLVWREDRVPADGLVEALGDTLRLEGRSGPAVLFSVREPQAPGPESISHH